MEDTLDDYMRNLTTLPGEVLSYSYINETAGYELFAPHPSNAVAIVIITVIYDSRELGRTQRSYHCYLDDSGKRMIGFGYDGEVADRIDQWLSTF